MKFWRRYTIVFLAGLAMGELVARSLMLAHAGTPAVDLLIGARQSLKGWQTLFAGLLALLAAWATIGATLRSARTGAMAARSAARISAKATIDAALRHIDHDKEAASAQAADRERLATLARGQAAAGLISEIDGIIGAARAIADQSKVRAGTWAMDYSMTFASLPDDILSKHEVRLLPPPVFDRVLSLESHVRGTRGARVSGVATAYVNDKATTIVTEAETARVALEEIVRECGLQPRQP